MLVENSAIIPGYAFEHVAPVYSSVQTHRKPPLAASRKQEPPLRHGLDEQAATGHNKYSSFAMSNGSTDRGVQLRVA